MADDCVWWVRGVQTKKSIKNERTRFAASDIGGVTGLNTDLIDEAHALYDKGTTLPERLWVNRLTRIKKLAKTKRKGPDGYFLPPFLASMGMYFLFNKAVPLFENADIRDIHLNPIKVFEYEDTEEITEPARFIVPGNMQDNFSPEHSPVVIEKMPHPISKERPHATYRIEEDEVALKVTALSAGDMWWEARFESTFFVRDRLAQELFAEGLADDFDLVRARVVTVEKEVA